ncbi:MAG TPA: aminoacyl-tRNA hydrolase [Anaerolineaceae bacterium]|nr:aminoacyl-tRNA hydrolase [Anaerolineaceae bacterium]
MESLFEKLGLARQPKLDEDTTPAGVYLIAGLGNPGREYRENRHNAGFMAVDRLAEAWDIHLTRVQSRALIGTGTVSGRRVVLAKPQTFMNLSGEAVSALLRFYKSPVSNLLVFHDDIDLPLGMLRLRPGGGAAGQKGIQSIITRLANPDFARARIGIGRPAGQRGAASYVLQDFSKDEMDILRLVLDRCLSAARTFIESGLEPAMNQYNGDIHER